jgi:MFS family permease
MVASSYCMYYTYQVAIPVIYDELYGYNELEIGLAFLPGLAGMTLGGVIAGKLVDWNFARTAREHGFDAAKCKLEVIDDFPIEKARYRACIPYIVAEVGLVVGYGWAVQSRAHVAVPLVIQFFACGLSTLLSHTASAFLVDIFPNKSSTAYASGQVVRCGMSAVSAAVIQPLADAVGRGWYFTIFRVFVGLSGVFSVVVSRQEGREWPERRNK